MYRHFTKEDIQMAIKHMIKYTTSLAIKEVQFKTTMKYDSISIRMTKIKNSVNTKSWLECKDTGSLSYH